MSDGDMVCKGKTIEEINELYEREQKTLEELFGSRKLTRAEEEEVCYRDFGREYGRRYADASVGSARVKALHGQYRAAIQCIGEILNDDNKEYIERVNNYTMLAMKYGYLKWEQIDDIFNMWCGETNGIKSDECV